MENNIEYWKNKIQKESGIPPHFFEIINNQELYNNKQKAKIKKLIDWFRGKKDDMKVKENAKSLKDFEKIEKTLILGAETSGKTSLSYMLQI